MKSIKRIVAAIAAGAMVISVAGCGSTKSGSSWTFKTDDYTVTGGQYLAYESELINDADSLTSSSSINYTGNTTTNSFSLSSIKASELWKKKVGDKSTVDWVKSKAEDLSKQFLGASIQCQEQSISLSDEEKDEIDSKATSSYSQYGQYFNFSARGLTEDTLKTVLEGEKLYDLLFNHIYGSGGTQEVSNEEVNQYISDHAASFKTIVLSKKNSDGDKYEGSDYDTFKSTVQKYCDEITQDGKSIDDVNKEYQISTGKSADSNIDALTENFAFENNDRNSSDFLNAIMGGSRLQNASFHDLLFSLSLNGAGVAEDDDNFYIVQRIDSTGGDNLTKYHDEALKRMKADEFNQSLYNSVSGHNYQTNKSAISKYSPKKLQKKVDAAQKEKSKKSSSSSSNS